MSKKWAISITAGIMALVYLFLLVGMPALEKLYPPCESRNPYNPAVPNITANWTAAGPSVDTRPYCRIYEAPLFLYFVPGLIGIGIVVAILKQKKEVK